MKIGSLLQTKSLFLFFLGDTYKDRWIESKHKSDYGKFVLTAGEFYGDEELDKGESSFLYLSSLAVSFRPAGIQTSENAKFYSMSAAFDKFSNEGKTMVVQFTVKHEQKIDCGGGYLKVREREKEREREGERKRERERERERGRERCMKGSHGMEPLLSL